MSELDQAQLVDLLAAVLEAIDMPVASAAESADQRRTHLLNWRVDWAASVLRTALPDIAAGDLVSTPHLTKLLREQTARYPIDYPVYETERPEENGD